MTQIASLLIVATVFAWLKVYRVSILQSERGAYTQGNIYAGTSAKNNARGLRRKGWRICRILQYMSNNPSIAVTYGG